MAPVATNENGNSHVDRIAALKAQSNETQVFNPFYSPTADSAADDDYKYATYKVSDIHVQSINKDERCTAAILPRCQLGTPRGDRRHRPRSLC